MTTRILPPEEWDRLHETEAGVPMGMDPARNQVIVAESGDSIVGVVVLMQTLRAECLWVHPAHRGRAGVFRRVLAHLFRQASALRFPTLLAAAMTTDMHAILAGLGADRLPADHYVLNVKEIRPCLR